MSGISRRTLVNEVGGLILFSFLPISSAKAAQLVDLRIWPSPEYTRITLEHDVPIPFKYTMVRNGSSVKMVVLIEGLTLTTKLKNLVSKQQPMIPIFPGLPLRSTVPRQFSWLLISSRMLIRRCSL